MGRSEPSLPFGKHAGEKISKLAKTNFQYVLWLSGRRIENKQGGIWNIVDHAAERIGTLKKYKKCFCDPNPGHAVWCLGHFAGNTVDETAKNIVAKLDDFNSPNFEYVRMWMVVNKNHPTFTKAAAEYIDKHRLCWSCGKKMKSDWPEIFHTKCSKKYQ